MEIIEINHGIAHRIRDKIFINSAIKGYDKNLYDALILHETMHSGMISFKDFAMEFGNEQLTGLKKKYYKFILTHPSSWSEFSPVWFSNGELQLNSALLIFYIVAILLGVVILKWI